MQYLKYNVRMVDYERVQEIYIHSQEQYLSAYATPRKVLPVYGQKMVDTVRLDGHSWKIITERYDLRKVRQNARRSRRRALSKFFGYAYTHKWQYFVTFTYSPAYVDRFSYGECYSFLAKWVKRQRKKYPDFCLLAVCEPHKNKAVHFHGLVSGVSWIDDKELCDCDDHVQICSWGIGRSDAQPIENQTRLINYISKYLVKHAGFSTRYYYRFGRLFEPSRRYARLSVVGAYVNFLLKQSDVFVKPLQNGDVVIRCSTIVSPSMFYAHLSPALSKGTRLSPVPRQTSLFDPDYVPRPNISL